MIAVSGTVTTRAELRREAEAAQDTYEALYAGNLTWRDWRPELACGDRQDIAVDEAWQEAREALEALNRALGWRRHLQDTAALAACLSHRARGHHCQRLPAAWRYYCGTCARRWGPR
jgi:hypothetical protein